MAINLTRCVGCYACVIACKMEHFLPPDVAWNRVAIFEGEGLNKQIYPTLCNHCKDPSCVAVCPTGALSIEEREAAHFDEAAVERKMHERGTAINKSSNSHKYPCFDRVGAVLLLV